MTKLSLFTKFGKDNRTIAANDGARTAVIYTRVSSKEQADKNLSLDFQKKTIEEYALRNNIRVMDCFGGTYESAKTDGRKEFQRMLTYIKQHKGKVTHILVYMIDRFSRTGGAAIALAADLRQKYGVDIYAIAQPTDTSNPSGVFQQSIQFLFSHYDNELRRERTLAGTRARFEQGIWITKPPIGYDAIKTNGIRTVVINAIGNKIKKAFVWKSEGEKNEAILSKLKSMGVQLNKQHLTKILKNPFYCGLISHNMLHGRIVEGVHEPLISKNLFLKVNEIHQSNAGYGVPHKKQQDEVPLKVFIKCSDCNKPFTGYIVKAKNLWYYKCRTIGCKCNKSAIKMHQKFTDFLADYHIKPELKAPLLKLIKEQWVAINKDNVELEQDFKKQLTCVASKLENIEESYYVMKEMDKNTFDKYHTKYRKEHSEINKQLSKLSTGISNPIETLEKALRLSLRLSAEWTSSDIEQKEKLQKLVFPEGIIYDKQNDAFRTTRVNSIFELIASQQRRIEQNERGQKVVDTYLSPSVRQRRFELPRPLYGRYHLKVVRLPVSPSPH